VRLPEGLAVIATVQRLRRLEVWTGAVYAVSGGGRVGVLVDVLECRATLTTKGEADALVVAVALADPLADELRENRWLRVDGWDAAGALTFDEWRIGPVHRDTETGRHTVTAYPFDVLLGARALVTHTDGQGVVRGDLELVGLTPTQILDTYVLPPLNATTTAGLYARGTVAPTAPIDLTVSWESPAAVCRRIAEITGTEFQVRRDPATNAYLLEFVDEIGASAPIADLRAGKNVQGLTQAREPATHATRVYPRGGEADGEHATMGRHVWEVQSVSGNDIRFVDPAGGPDPIAFDGQLVDLWLERIDGTTRQVTATSATSQLVTVTSASNVVAGQRLRFVENSSRHDLVYLESPADRTAHGIVVGVADAPDVPATYNALPNPAGRAWPSGTLPAGWSAVGAPTLSKETGAAFVRTAGASIKAVATADGQGVQSPAGGVPFSADRPYASGFAAVYVASGQVRVELVVTKADGSTVVSPVAPARATSTQVGVWTEALGIEAEDLVALGARARESGANVAVRVVAHGGPATFYVDGAQATNSGAFEPFVEGSGGTKLWQAANEKLRTHGAPAVTYAARLVDLARLDPATWGDDCALYQGGRVRVTDARLPTGGAPLLVSTRIVEIARDYLVPGQTQVTLSSAPDDLYGTLARPKPANRQPPAGLGLDPRYRPVHGAIADEAQVGGGVSVGGVTAREHGRSTAGRLFLETWERGAGDWILRLGPGAPELWTSQAGSSAGGNLLLLRGPCWLVFNGLWAFDPAKLYRIAVRATVDSYGGGSASGLYVGFEGVTRDNALCNINGLADFGSQHYAAASENFVFTSGSYVERVGWVRGWALGGAAAGGRAPDPLLPAKMHANVRYIRPVLIGNNGGTSSATVWIDSLTVDVFDEDGQRRIYDAIGADGHLDPETRQSDGVTSRVLSRGHVDGTAQHNAAVAFPTNFQNIPFVSLRGGVNYEPRSAQWSGTYSATLPQYEDLAPLDLSVAGFTMRARLRQKSGGTPQNLNFPLSNSVTTVGSWTELTLTPGGSNSGQYTVRFKATVSASGVPGYTSPEGEVFAAQWGETTIVVAVDTYDDATLAWTERASKTYTKTSSSSSVQTSNYADSVNVTVAGLTSGDKVRVRLKSRTIGGSSANSGTGSVHGYDGSVGEVTVAGGKNGVSYQSGSTESVATKTPDADDVVAWEAIEVSSA
jgi:hypothetical protein